MTMPRKEYDYRNISIPKGLVEQAERLLEDLQKEGFDLSYQSIADFVKDAIRRRIEELRQIYFLGEEGRETPQ